MIDLVAGARPNFMKIAPLLRAMGKTPGTLARLIHTGQHYDEGMSDVFFRQLDIRKPDVSLGVGSGSHGEQTARILVSFEKHLQIATPRTSGVVVVGDVNSTVACSLAAVKLGIPVAHVEAGLRSFDRSMPEEINRVLTDAIAHVLLVSEPSGEVNLLKEGIDRSRIHYVGNVMIDTLVHELPEAHKLDLIPKLGLEGGKYGYVTLHRPSNVDDRDRLAEVVAVLARLSRKLPLVFPVHPRTLDRLRRFQLESLLTSSNSIRILEPIGYRESTCLLEKAAVVLTDSGGIQEEATYLNVPCLTLRSNTERPATVSSGTNTLVGENLSLIEPAIESIMSSQKPTSLPIPGWDGKAAERIVEVLKHVWKV